MTALQAYLQNSKTRKVLSKKSGEAGFSLIELVVVVAVLAILSAIAIPAFTNISEKARASAASNTLATVVKECAVKLADTGAGNYAIPTLDGYRNSDGSTKFTSATATAGTCSNATGVVLTLTSSDSSKYPTFAYNMNTGAKTCAASGAALTRGCPVDGGSW